MRRTARAAPGDSVARSAGGGPAAASGGGVPNAKAGQPVGSPDAHRGHQDLRRRADSGGEAHVAEGAWAVRVTMRGGVLARATRLAARQVEDQPEW